MVSTANDGSGVLLAYSDNTGTWTTFTLVPQTQLNSIQNGQVIVPLSNDSAQQLKIQVYTQGGSPSPTATFHQVAVAISRNVNETLQWDSPNPFNPMSYNAECMDNAVYTDTLGDLRARVISRLGFINPNTIDTSTTFGQMQTRVQARLGFKTLRVPVPIT